MIHVRLVKESKSLCFMALILLCVGYQGSVIASADDVTGYYMTSTNECPEALVSQRRNGKWPGVTITPIQMVLIDGTVCALSNEFHDASKFYMTLTCSSNLKLSGVYEFNIHDNFLVLTRKSEKLSYVRCRNLSLPTQNDLSSKRIQDSGVNVSDGVKLRPYGNNNSMRMKMNVVFP